jgi:carboxypeptidase Taq
MEIDAAYAELGEHLNRIHQLGAIGQMLAWDEQVNLPKDSADQRAAQHAVLAETAHAAQMDPRLGELLAELEAASATLSGEQEVVVKEARRPNLCVKRPSNRV